MHPEMEMLRCAIVRGGTSTGVFIMRNQYPEDPAKRDAIILAVYGSPDIRQIDGLGGTDVLTSKHAIISPSSHADADVDYTFGQVSIDTAFVDYRGNCGNISSAVGPFASVAHCPKARGAGDDAAQRYALRCHRVRRREPQGPFVDGARSGADRARTSRIPRRTYGIGETAASV
jgi:hypothetical protein